MAVNSKFAIYDTGGAPRILELAGREEWALSELLSAGNLGCTPIDNPGPRWSDYIHKLRKKRGLVIETVTEPNGGEFAGFHARYVLRSRVERLGAMEMAA
jgi:hypothetical protein